MRTGSTQYVFVSILLLVFILSVKCAPNSKSRCALECYAQCMRSGTANAGICNCPVVKEPQKCSNFEEQFQKALIVQNLPITRTKYLDAHTIHISISPHPSAFAYIFEYSTISTHPDKWIFAGAYTEPEAQFSVLDPCRDYHFRVLVVLRSSDPSQLFAIIRPQAIPVQLPPFVLKQEQIKVELPRMVNATANHIKMFVKWTVPFGYSDGDIYGYESPSLYPIQCSTPEEELPQPRIEIVKGGGRLAVLLPSSVLNSRCRMWVEVRMLPRCVRLEPFNIQKNIEIDCSKNTDLEVCSKDANPVCLENVRIGGELGKAKISWEKPQKPPLYYHVRYGPAQTKGTAPFVSWQLAAKREVRVDGSLSSFSLDIPEDEDFGVQVCAIMSKNRKRPKFGVVEVLPFQCVSCKPAGEQSEAIGRCGECSKILGSTVIEKDWKIKTPPLRNQPKEQDIEQNPTVYRMETDLSVAPKRISAKSDTRLTPELPLEIEKAEKINLDQNSTKTTTTTMSTETETAPQIATSSTNESSTENTFSEKLSTDINEAADAQDTTTMKESMNIKTIVEEETDEREQENQEKDEKEEEEHEVDKEGILDLERNEKERIQKELAEKTIDESIENIEKVLEGTTNSTDQFEQLEKRLEEAAQKLQETITTLAANSSDVRHHEPTKKCLTSEGIVCEFGCLDRKTCICPPVTHARLRNKVCISRDAMPHTNCLPKKEINATWDAETGNVMVRRSDAIYHIENSESVDKLFVEFGKVRLAEELNNLSRIEFADETRQKVVVMIQSILKSSVFSTEPFIFHVNQTIDMNAIYGMRLCVFNSSQIRHPHTHNWDDESRFEKDIAEVVQLSPVYFTNQLLANQPDNYWNTLVTVAKVAILILLAIAMFVLLYLNCTKIKTLYDRKRTHYFRPFYIDPAVHMPTRLKREPSRGYYDVRSRVIM
ncbi:unnamed protein product [Caenorhabditis bovis]|uniref:Fibronectin type-III domain-containing protein n=1 Tax=Caenorhabditis bovis TaxID=2654633 RepID=A0A8S1EC58_9PELO|nr:unnamed protein product [Caenorhabditis bovis]